MEFEPDFSKHDYYQLLDAKANIDKKKYPARYEDVVERLAKMEVPAEIVNSSDVSNSFEDAASSESKAALPWRILLLTFFAGACIYFGKIPSRRGGVSLVEEPVMFFLGICIFGGFVVYGVVRYFEK